MSHWARPSFPLWEDDPATSEDPSLAPQPQDPSSNADEGMNVDGDHAEEEEVLEALDEGEGGEVDVRVRRPPPAKRGSKSKEENMVHSLVRSYLVYRRLIKPVGSKNTRSNDVQNVPIPSFLPSPEESVVKSYMAMQACSGPTRDNLLILWSSPMSHPWNQQALSLLLEDFPDYVKEKALLQLTQLSDKTVGADTDVLALLDEIVSPTSVKQILEKKLDNSRQRTQTDIRKVYKMKQPSPTTPESIPLTDTEIRAEIHKKKLELDKTNRRRERRNLRYIRRHEIIEEQIMLATDDESRELWLSIQTFYAYFTNNDTSSDESDGDCPPPLVKTVRRVRRHWISPAVSAVFHFIDGHFTPEYVTGMKKRGAAPLPRYLESKRTNKRSKPTPELPVNFYSSDVPPLVLKALRPRPRVPIPQIPTRK